MVRMAVYDVAGNLTHTIQGGDVAVGLLIGVLVAGFAFLIFTRSRGV